jgi:hypothetical protein
VREERKEFENKNEGSSTSLLVFPQPLDDFIFCVLINVFNLVAF